MTPEQIADWRLQKNNPAVERRVKVHSDLLIVHVRPDYSLHSHKPGQNPVLGLGYWEPRYLGSADWPIARSRSNARFPVRQSEHDWRAA